MRRDPTPNNQVDTLLKRTQWIAGGLGVIGAALCAAGAFWEPASFFPAYLVAFLYWVEVSLGCLALLMVHSVVSGRWGIPIQRLLAAGARTLPLMALLFVPLLAGLPTLYTWVGAGLPDDPLLTGKRLYLNEPFFIGRAFVYFVVWIGLAYAITRPLYRHDQTGDGKLLRRAQRLGVAGLIVYFLTASFAAIDWSMSLEPDWFSSSYGWLAISRQVMVALAFVTAVLGLVAHRQPFVRVISPRIAQELGMLLLSTLLLWAYLEFIQYLVMWYGDIPHEVGWYVRRSSGGWQWIALGLMALAFALPLCLMLLPGLKQRMPILAGAAALIVLLLPAESYWVVKPVFQAQLALHWLDLALPLTLGALWIAVFSWALRRHGLLPRRHPKLAQALEPEEQEALESARSGF